jgi:phosphopantothenoylcysteine decarboxylase / phosphopantothenate---cysteine ligase
MLHQKKILVGITGSIAAYKVATLVRLLIKQGAEVKVIMTKSATEFISPLTLSTLSKQHVLTNLYNNDEWENHVQLGRWADLMLIAPLSANTLSKMASGACDNILLAIYLSATCPVVMAPAMDEDMWHHPAVQNNIQKLKSYGNHILPVNNGELASGLIGEGRMAEPEEMVGYLKAYFAENQDLKGKKILITAGPTYEAIDPVRFIGNRSSGKMGVAIARECFKRGADVILVLGPVSSNFDTSGLNVIKVQTANEMFEACKTIFHTVDIAIMAAAVADYTPKMAEAQKIKKQNSEFSLELVKTPDILQYLGSVKRQNQLLVGFALETHNEHRFALEKLKSKNADLIVLNSITNPGVGFNFDTNQVTIFDKMGKVLPFELKQKNLVAKDIVNTLITYTNELV